MMEVGGVDVDPMPFNVAHDPDIIEVTWGIWAACLQDAQHAAAVDLVHMMH